MKKALKLLFSLAVVMLITACARGDRPVTITLLLLGNRPTNGRADAAIAKINEITAERIGAVLRTRYIEWADWMNRYQLTIASGDPSIDLVISSTTWLFGWEIVQRGGFFPLTPQLLQENAPMTWAAIPQEHWDLVSRDGYIFFIPENQFTQFTNHGMFWRKDWAREGGLEEILTFEDLGRYWEIVKQNHPQAFPWDVAGAEYLEIGLINGFLQGRRPVQPIIGLGTGNFNIFQYNVYDPRTVISYFMDGDELIEAAHLFRLWSDMGFWRADVLNFRGETSNLFLSGLSGSHQHHTNTFVDLRTRMDREQPGSEIQMFWWGKENNNVNRDVISHGAMSINARSRNVELALQMYDLLRNDREIYLLFNHGIEGIDYIVNPDGTFSRPPSFCDMTDALGTNFWGGRMDEFEPVWDTQWSGRQDFLAHKNSFARDYPLAGFVFDSRRVQAEMAAIGEVSITHLPAIQFGRAGAPELAVANFRDALRRAGFDRVKAEIQSQLNAFWAQQ